MVNSRPGDDGLKHSRLAPKHNRFLRRISSDVRGNLVDGVFGDVGMFVENGFGCRRAGHAAAGAAPAGGVGAGVPRVSDVGGSQETLSNDQGFGFCSDCSKVGRGQVGAGQA